ncbi:hypothetical protein R1Y80_16855 [Streptomyces sp. JL1001]|uniref:Uncharacterized protein n=1 Tax=Streptomyces sp. JL1001 TaxID=3078227 RepID=A0AAU8KFP8_9ACTN
MFTALDNLVRIVQDNVAAEMVFPKDTKAADALKGKEDLLSDEILIHLGTARGVTKSAPTYNMAAGAMCPINKWPRQSEPRLLLPSVHAPREEQSRSAALRPDAIDGADRGPPGPTEFPAHRARAA